MKNLILTLGLCFPFFLQGQTIDSVAFKRVDSLMLAAREKASKGEFDNALLINTNAEKLAVQKFGESSISYGKTCFNRGRILYFQSNYKEAENWYLKAKAIWEKILDKKSPYYASTLNNLALLYGDMGLYDKAESLYHQAIAIREEILGRNHPDFIASLNNLATLFIESGYYEKAETLLLETQSIREKAFGRTHPDYARGLNNLAVLYHYKGDNEKVEALLLESLAIKEKILGKEHPEYARSLGNLANHYSDMGNYEKVEPLYLEVLAIRGKVQAKDHPDYAQTLTNLGIFYSDIGNYQKAQTCLQEALGICEKVLGPDNPYNALVTGALGSTFYRLGDNNRAEPLYIKAKNIVETSLGKSHPDYANRLMNLGYYYKDVKKIQKADSLFTEALAVREKSLGTEHLDYAQTLYALAEIAWILKKPKEASIYLQKAEALEKKELVKAMRYLSEQELTAYIQVVQRSMNWIYSFAQQNNLLLTTSYDNVLFYKGFLLNATARLRSNFASQLNTNDNYQKLRSYQRRLATEYSKPLADRQNVAELEENANTFEKELTRTIAGFGEAIRQVQWSEVQQKLKPGEAAIEFVHYQLANPNSTESIMYAALVLRAGAHEPTFVKLFEKKQLDTLLLKTAKTKADYINQLYSNNKTGKSLYDLIWKPLETALNGINRIYFSPTGLLNRLNIASITLPQQQTIEKTERLTDRYELIELGSTRQLVLSPIKSVLKTPIDAQLYGGIQYEVDSAAVGGTNSSGIKNALASSRGFSIENIDSTLRGGKWNYLKWTEVEVSALEPMLSDAGLKAGIYKGTAATEETFKQIGTTQASPRVIHLATHGFFFPDPKLKKNVELGTEQPSVFKLSEHPMIRSGIIMAGGNYAWQKGKALSPNREDGILTAYEISQMNLSNTELVVLSACETGLGDIQGNEGVYGLQRAFKIAGAKYLIMSLWQVPDFQTQELMTTFYSKWLDDKMNIPAAFRAAQNAMKNKYKEPFYWAGFVLIE